MQCEPMLMLLVGRCRAKHWVDDVPRVEGGGVLRPILADVT